MSEYNAFLRAKIKLAGEEHGAAAEIVPHAVLKDHQRACVEWLVRGGRRALFAAFGLGKTLMQIDAVRLVLDQHGGRGLIVIPLGVRQEFVRDARDILGLDIRFIRSIAEAGEHGIYLTNYETVRDGKIDPSAFTVASLDEASILRGMGGTKTFREFMRLFEQVRFRFVATATPSPNDYIELLAYAAFLGIMDVGEAKTRFFKRDSTKADVLTLHPHKEEEFWLWVSTWALFVQKPSDLGFSDEGYALPPLRVIYHSVATEMIGRDADRSGQMMLIRDGAIGLQAAAKEKRETLPARVAKVREILDAAPDDHFLIWHDLEAERHAIQAAVPEAISVYGTQDLEARERSIIDFSNGKFKYLSVKPVIAGSGCNFQRHCHKAVFAGIGFKFNDFIQAIHRIQRFLQPREVEIHVVFAESEREILRTLQRKWLQHEEMVKRMSEIIRQYGLSAAAMAKRLERSLGCERIEVSSEHFRLANADTVEETRRLPDASVGLILSSIPFSTQYEYSPSYNDFGHTDDDAHFWAQMGFLTPELLRVLKPGRLCAIHVKDRIIPGGINGLGFQTLSTFHCDAITHFRRHGFAYMGMKTITTDVVRENNQTYRLGWTEQCKDGSKMSFGVPEYLLLFRRPPSDLSDGYADERVVKDKKWRVDGVSREEATRRYHAKEDRRAAGELISPEATWPTEEDFRSGYWQHPAGYSRARWQLDAHGFTRSSGMRHLTPDEMLGLPADEVYKVWKAFNMAEIYDFEHHVRIAEDFEERGQLPSGFMLMPPHSVHPDVWTDIARMLSLNTLQSHKGREMHLCPMQFDIADRAIKQWSNPGEVVFDPFGGLMTVPYRAVLAGRIGWGNELNPRYFLDGVKYCEAAARQKETPSLFDFAGIATPVAAE